MSDKPVAERLQVKRGRRLAVVGATDAMNDVIGAKEARADAADADVVLLFAADRASLEAKLPALLSQLRAEAILWIAYPKLSSKLAGDLNRNVIAAAAPAYGLDTVSQIAIDDVWSALRVKRVP
jgi:hypothetical protein